VKSAPLRGPLVLVVLCAVPLLLWARSGPLDPRFDGSFATLESIAVLCAFAGTSAFALNLVLGARLRFVDALFGGLDRMYKAHRVNGQVAFALLLGHVALILASRATVSTDTALDLLGPGAGRTVFVGVLAFAAMTVAILLTLFVRLGHEVFVYVQRAFGFIFLAATYHVFTTDGAADESMALNVYMATLATLGVAAFVYRSLLGNVLVRRLPYTVRAVNRLDEFVTEIVMEPLQQPLQFAPGQFLFVNFRSLALGEQFRPLDVSVQRQVFSIRAGEMSNQFHPFSITSASHERTLRITVKAVGDYTRALRGLEEGADAIVEGPYGSFSHRGLPVRRQLWLAGGIGVTPFLSMARSLRYANEPAVDFYYCVERAEEAHFLDELRAIAVRRGDFRLSVVARDEVGLLTAERLARESGDLAERETLICGPPAMIESLRSQLLAHGVPGDRIHAEEFGFAKLGESGAGTRARPEPVRRAPRPPRRSPAVAAVAVLLLAVGAVIGNETISRGGDDSARSESGVGTGSVSAGKSVFSSAGCGDCHALEAAGSSGSVGPDLDESKPDAARVHDLVTDGAGAMPSYKDQLTDRQIRDVAAFVAETAVR
jgi:predicted ferric reductase/mono/diheme cytochrome c family protein